MITMTRKNELAIIAKKIFDHFNEAGELENLDYFPSLVDEFSNNTVHTVDEVHFIGFQILSSLGYHNRG